MINILILAWQNKIDLHKITFLISIIFYSVGPNPPMTLTQEWRDAQAEKMKLRNMNPISGVSSKK